VPNLTHTMTINNEKTSSSCFESPWSLNQGTG
jgi:hypothetical protein